MQIQNITKNSFLAIDCMVADNFFTRFAGLMGKKSLSRGCGLLITPCNSIHMFFMKFPLDIVFIDKSNTITHIVENIQPWQTTKIVWSSRSVLELPAGTVKASRTEVGDRVEIVECGELKVGN